MTPERDAAIRDFISRSFRCTGTRFFWSNFSLVLRGQFSLSAPESHAFMQSVLVAPLYTIVQTRIDLDISAARLCSHPECIMFRIHHQ